MARHKLSLKTVFNPDALYDTWKKRLWDSFRKQKFSDLIEYYDYNRAISDHARRLCPIVISGTYKASAPLQLEVGKTDKLVRRLQIPHPDDGVILQAIAEALLPFVRQKQKVKNAYFSRAHGRKKDIHTGHIALDYPWFVLWPRYQKKILDFASAKPFVVTTDIQNFFDSLSHTIIRRALAPIDPRHGLTDLTIYLLEEFCRRDFYAPPGGRGLPQLDFDAPGLLAHLVLFPVDNYLDRVTQGSYARWVDDINFAATDRHAARLYLRGLERTLTSLDLRLGGGKTEILNRDKAERYLQVDQNRKLDEYQGAIEANQGDDDTFRSLVVDFFQHRGSEQYGQWDKVLKRYYNLMGSSRIAKGPTPKLRGLRRRVERASYSDFEELSDYQFRLTLIRFWSTLPPSEVRVRRIMQYMRGMSKYDDVVTLALARLLTTWSLTPDLVKLTLAFRHVDRRRPGGFVAMCMLLLKYGKEDYIVDFILKNELYWSTNDFLSRQVITLWSILDPLGSRAKALEMQLNKKQLRSVNDLFDFFRGLRAVRRLDWSLWGYLSPTNMKRPYYLSKAIIASNVLRSSRLAKVDRDRLAAALSLVEDNTLKAIALNTIQR